jgi:hypothetical protein
MIPTPTSRKVHSGPGALQRTRWGLAWLSFFVQF